MALDGVSGVPPPQLPEDMSFDLRNFLRYNLRVRLAHETDKTLYDNSVANLFQVGQYGQRHDTWLRNFFAFSISQITSLGSTTVAVASLLGNYVTYIHVGDSSIRIFRYNYCFRAYIKHFGPVHQTDMLTDTHCVERP